MMCTLSSLQSRLQSNGLIAELRGNGASSFLFADHNGRSVEVSIDRDTWWIEFWERSSDPDEQPVKEATLYDERDVQNEVVKWLSG